MDIIFNFLVLLKSRGQQTFPVKDQVIDNQWKLPSK